MARVPRFSPGPRTFVLTHIGWGAVLFAILWAGSYRKFAGYPAEYRKERTRLLQALRWVEPIPDNPDLGLILPFPEVLRNRALFLERQGVLRLHFVHAPLAAAVQKAPSPSDGTYGVLESAILQPDGRRQIKGWSWLPERQARADCVVLGAEDVSGNFKPLTVIGTGVKRPDLVARASSEAIGRAGFSHAIKLTNLPPDAVRLAGWGIDLAAQQAWPLAGSVPLQPTSQDR